MRILIVHNFYGSSAPSGENQVVQEERDLLRSAGYEVIEHFTYSDTVRDRGLFPIIRTALSVPWNQSAQAALRARIQELSPDVMHVHNVFPLLSPAAFGAAAGTRTAVVHTLHNYRTVCAGASVLRDNTVCTDCLDRRSVLPAVRRGCYRGSRLATLPIAASIALHRRLRTYATHVDALVAFTRFHQALFVKAGLPEQRIHVKPNCFPGVARCVPWDQRQRKAVFVGRVSREKGLHVLLEAWARWGEAAPALEIVGGGPDLEKLRAAVPVQNRENVVFLGLRPVEQTHTLLSQSRLMIVPSIWFEGGFPLVLREALAFGVPVIASRLGPLQEILGSDNVGRLFTPGDPDSLWQTVSSVWEDDAALREMSRNALQAAETRYSPAAHIAGLQEIYQCAMDHRRAASCGGGPACHASVIR